MSRFRAEQAVKGFPKKVSVSRYRAPGHSSSSLGARRTRMVESGGWDGAVFPAGYMARAPTSGRKRPCSS